MVINKHNINDIRESAKIMATHGIKKFGATPMVFGCKTIHDKSSILNHKELEILVNELVWIKENLNLEVDIFESLPKCAFSQEILSKNLPFIKQSCNAGRSSVLVSNKGDVRPCPDSSKVYGNLLECEMVDAYTNMAEWRDGSILPDECKKCAIVDNCFGACRVQAFNYSGGVDKTAKDPWMKESFDEDPTRKQSGQPKTESKKATLSPSSKIAFRKDEIYWRGEPRRSSFIICNPRILKMQSVNKELFAFFHHLYRKKDMPSTVGELANQFNVSCNDPAFQGVIRTLSGLGFIVIS